MSDINNVSRENYNSWIFEKYEPQNIVEIIFKSESVSRETILFIIRRYLLHITDL